MRISDWSSDVCSSDLRDRTQAQMQEREAALRAADSDLAQRRSSLTADAYAKARSELEAEVMDLQRSQQEERRRLDQRFSQGMAEIGRASCRERVCQYV